MNSDRIDSDNIKCLSFNARSVLNKWEELICTVEIFRPDVMGVTESFANEDIADSELSIPGYDLFRKDRTGGHRGGGVLLYIRSGLGAAEFLPKTPFPEQVWCRVQDRVGKEMLIGVCYRTPEPQDIWTRTP